MNNTENTKKELFEAPEVEVIVIVEDAVMASLNSEEEGYGDSQVW